MSENSEMWVLFMVKVRPVLVGVYADREAAMQGASWYLYGEALDENKGAVLAEFGPEKCTWHFYDRAQDFEAYRVRFGEMTQRGIIPETAPHTLDSIMQDILDLMNGMSRQVRRHRKMLYEMTSLTDWLRESYSEDEYKSIVREFEADDDDYDTP